MILSDFKKWLELNTDKMERYGLKLIEICEPADALVLTYENKDFFTELTIRDNGFEDIEICDKQSEELVFYQHCMTDKKLNIDALMNNYLDYFDEFYK